MGLLGFAAAFWVHWSTHMVHLVGFVWLAWALAAAHLLVVDPRRKRVAALAVVIGLWWLGANPQYAYYGTLAVVCIRRSGSLVARRATGGLLTPGPRASLAGAWRWGRRWPRRCCCRRSRSPTASCGCASPSPRTTSPGATSSGCSFPTPWATPPTGCSSTPTTSCAWTRRSSAWSRRCSAPSPWAAPPQAGGGAERLLLAGGAGVVAGPGLQRPAQPGPLPAAARLRPVPGGVAVAVVLPAFALPLAALGLQDVLDGVRRARVVAAGACGGAALVVVAWYLTNGRGRPGADVSRQAGRLRPGRDRPGRGCGVAGPAVAQGGPRRRGGGGAGRGRRSTRPAGIRASSRRAPTPNWRWPTSPPSRGAG